MKVLYKSKLLVLLFILLLQIFNLNSANAFYTYMNRCKVNFQEELYINGLVFSNGRTTIKKNEYSEYNWYGDCENGYATGKGNLRVIALDKIYTQIGGTAHNGYFIGKTHVHHSNRGYDRGVDKKTIKGYSNYYYEHNDKKFEWVYKQIIFDNQNSFYNYILKVDSNYAKLWKIENQKLVEILQKKKEKIEYEEELLEYEKGKKIQDSSSSWWVGVLGILGFGIILLFIGNESSSTESSSSEYSYKDHEIRTLISRGESGRTSKEINRLYDRNK